MATFDASRPMALPARRPQQRDENPSECRGDHEYDDDEE
jgi:hypothetical protein